MHIIFPYCPNRTYIREPIQCSLPLAYYDTRISSVEKDLLFFGNDTNLVKKEYYSSDPRDSGHPQAPYGEATAVPCQISLVHKFEAVDFVRFCFNTSHSPFLLDSRGFNPDLSGRKDLLAKNKKEKFCFLSPCNTVLALILQDFYWESECEILLRSCLVHQILLAINSTGYKKAGFFPPVFPEKVETCFFAKDFPELLPVFKVLSCDVASFHNILESMEYDKGLWIPIREAFLGWISVVYSQLPLGCDNTKLLLNEIKETLTNLSGHNPEKE